MPWNHCGQVIGDAERLCPSCGQSKQRWTLNLGATRRFVLGKKPVEAEWELDELSGTGYIEGREVGAVEGDWELDTLGVAPVDLQPSMKEAEPEEEDWELDALSAESDLVPVPGPERPEEDDWELDELSASDGELVGGPSRKQANDEDPDWDLEELSDEGGSVAGGPTGPARASTRPQTKTELEEREPEDDWELEAILADDAEAEG